MNTIKFTAFTFIHNALHGAYPLFESIASVLPYVDRYVVLDCESNDGTSELLQKLSSANPKIELFTGKWDLSIGPANLLNSWEQHKILCKDQLVLHVEADEVFDQSLISKIDTLVKCGANSLAFYRNQVEQNFQRIRWYDTPCHRVWMAGSVDRRGNTTIAHFNNEASIPTVSADYGFFWDACNCFKDQFFNRIEQNAEVWQQGIQYRRVPIHANRSWDTDLETVTNELNTDPIWTWNYSPFNLPGLLALHLGKPLYEPNSEVIKALCNNDDEAMIAINSRKCIPYVT